MATTQSQQIVLKSQRSDKKRGTGLKVAYSHTRFGCRMCKARKIRCDETHPSCRNCIKTGRQCDGIPQPAGSLRFTTPVTLSHFWPAKGSKLGQEEVVFLDVFRHHLVDGIVGDASSPSWKRLVLQAVHEEPALCHAAVAFGALHDLPSRSAGTTELTPTKRVALRHYNQCIKGLQEVISRREGSTNIILLCILLCICFELRMHNPQLSLNHLEHGLRILQSNPKSVDDDLAMAFTKLDVQSSVFLGSRSPVLDVQRWTDKNKSQGPGFQQAHKDLTCLLNKLISFFHSKAHVFRYEHVELAPLHLHWEAEELGLELEFFRGKHLPPTSWDAAVTIKQQPMQRVLWLKYLMARVWLRSSLALEEMSYDLLLPEFTTIVTLAESLVNGAKKPENPSKFSLNMGIIFPLFKTAQKCRSPQVRRRAIKLLSKIKCSEGPWEGVACQKYAERVVEMEEEGLNLDPSNLDGIGPELIPEWRRVHLMDIQPEYEKQYAVVTFRRRLNGLDGEWDDLVEMVRW